MSIERVLVIEESPETNQWLADLMLEFSGYRYLKALSGEEGLALALEEHPALVILDEHLPEMDGFGVLQTLREQHEELPVIFTSSNHSPESILRAFRLGASDYVARPIDPEEMLAATRRTLTADRSGRERGALTEQLREANRQLQRQLQELNTVYTIGRAVTSLLDLNLVLNRVVEAAVYTAGAEEGMLMLLNEESDELYLRAAKGMGERTARNLRVQVDDSTAGRSLTTDRPVHLIGERAKIATGYLVNALLYVPVRVPERGAIGVLGVANRHSKKTFSERDIFLLSALANYAAIAIENARLFEEVETERTKLEAVLREAEETIILVDEGNNVLLCNAAACNALNLVDAELVSRPVDEAIPQSAVKELFADADESDEAIHCEVTLDNGRTFNAQVTPIEGVGRVLMMQDITRFKELDRLKSEFVATVSHDLRTPLTSIQGYVELLPKVGPVNEQQQEFIRRVQESMSDITNLISDLLDIRRIETKMDLEMEPCDLGQIIDEVVAELKLQAEKKQQDLRWDPLETPLMVQGDVGRLRQVVDNLVNNAIKYTPEGGWIAVSAVEGDDYAAVNVADNGIGIPPEQQPYVFDRFYRVETEETMGIKGTGLGLAIVKAVVEKHHGRVWVESKPGVGSAFSFVLPALEA